MITQHYALANPIALEDGRSADGVLVNDQGAWLGEVVTRIGDYDTVTPYSDEGNDYIPVPDDLDWYPTARQLA